MTPRFLPRSIALIGAFSLPEVTISMGIISLLVLPSLAMLAGGGSMQTLAKDRETASRIARIVTSSIRGVESGDSFEIGIPGAGPVRIATPGKGGVTTIYAAFGEDGRFLGEIPEAGFRKGMDSPEAPVHVMSLRLSAVRGDPRLLELSLSVQRPGTAAEAARAKETFQTRLAIP